MSGSLAARRAAGSEDALPVDRIEELIASVRSDADVPGLAVGVVLPDGLAWSGGTGWADLETGRRPDERTLSRVASITKTFTATAILQLRDEGRLSLDDPLARHVPEFSQARAVRGRVEDVTLRRLLTHRSGLVTESPPTSWDEPRFPTLEEVLAALPETGIVIPPDSAWKYSNLGFGLLGEVVTRASGRPYARYLRDELLDPLGLVDADLALDERRAALVATGYSPGDLEDRPPVAPGAPLDGIAAAGQLYANVRDLTTWVAFQFRTDGGPRAGAQVLAGLTLAEMHRPAFLEADWSAGQALGWRATRIGDRVYHNHGGGIHGFGSSIAFSVPQRVGAVVLANLWPTMAAPELSLALLETILDARLGSASAIPALERVRRVVRPAVAPAGEARAPFRADSGLPPSASPPELRPLLGRFVAEPGIGTNVEYRDGRLRLTLPHAGAYTLHAPAALDPAGDGAFVIASGRGAGETVVMKPAPGGRLDRFEIGGFVYRRRDAS